MSKILTTFLIALLIVGCTKIESKSTTDEPTAPTVPTQTYSLSGNIFISPMINVESDINDPFAETNRNNNSINTAQTINNFSTINGFATKNPTGRIVELDHFASSNDEFDYFQTHLQKDQSISLQVVDYQPGGVFDGDLDIYLYNESLTVVAYSNGIDDEFESIIVPNDGLFYIEVHAFSGTSKYILSLDNISISNVPNKSSSTNFLPNQAIIKYNNNSQKKSSNLTTATVSTNHVENRPALAKFNFLPKSVNSLTSFQRKLSIENELSYQKVQTIKAIKELSQQGNIEYIEPNYIRTPFATPNDSLYSLQWHYPAINLPEAWDITDGDRAQDVIVAVIDTGVLLTHEDLTNQLVSGYDFISDPSNANDNDGIDNNPDDPGDSTIQNQSSWHGTHVAGTISAQTNNNTGIAGVSWEAKIMPLRALGVNGGSSYDVMQAVLFASGLTNDSGTLPPQVADIINLSLGGSGNSITEQNAFTAARDAGVIIVAAAGNESTSSLSYPASYDGVISVSATGFDNSLAPYSNFGSRIDIAAPGGNQTVDLNNDNNADGVLSTLVDDSTGTRNASYAFYQGTSMAAPHMAGVIALMRAVHPSLSPDDLDTLISSGSISTDLGFVGRDDSFGYGLIDAFKAVQQAQILNNGGSSPPLPAIISALPSQLSLGNNITSATFTIENIGDTAAQIVSFNDNASWLTIAEDSVDANNLGTYSVSIDKTGLADNSRYLATVTFNISTGATLEVPISMTKGSISTIGDVGTLYLLLLDSTGDVSQQVLPTDDGNGTYSYAITNIEEGNYTLLVGSDIDNDLILCQTGESCGAYPTLSQISEITINSNLSNIDFTADILSSFNTNHVLSTSHKNTYNGFSRLSIIPQNHVQ